MIKICKNRIVIGCASLSLPEGLYINKMSNNGRGIVFSDEEKTFTLSVFSNSNLETTKERKEDLTGCEFNERVKNSDIYALTLNGLEGYYTLYKDTIKEYYEAKIKNIITGGNEYLCILISVFIQKSTMGKVLDNPAINTFFCELRAE